MCLSVEFIRRPEGHKGGPKGRRLDVGARRAPKLLFDQKEMQKTQHVPWNPQYMFPEREGRGLFETFQKIHPFLNWMSSQWSYNTHKQDMATEIKRKGHLWTTGDHMAAAGHVKNSLNLKQSHNSYRIKHKIRFNSITICVKIFSLSQNCLMRSKLKFWESKDVVLWGRKRMRK